MTFEEKLIDMFKTVDVVLSQAEEVYKQNEEMREKVAHAIPLVVDALVAGGFIDESEKVAAADALSDHSKALHLLARTAQHSISRLGSRGNADESTNGLKKKAFATRRSQSREDKPFMRESDKVFLRSLGLEHLIQE